jgi:hypothetical protein
MYIWGAAVFRTVDPLYYGIRLKNGESSLVSKREIARMAPIELVIGDITQQDVDVVVNAANSAELS